MKNMGYGLLVFLLWSSGARAQTPFYQGKTIRIVVGYPAGSAHDQWARLIAPYLSKYVAGNPNTIVQNMAGAGSMVAANYVYNVARPDGLTLAVVNAALYFDQLLARKEVQFDWSKFAWIGSSTPTNAILYMWADTPYKTIHDIRKASVPPKCGATGTGNTGYYLPKLLEQTIGAKFNLVTGYQGGADIELAVERGEVQCRAFTIQVFFGREPFHTWRSKGLVRVLVQTGKKRDARLPDVPLLTELMDQYQTAQSSRRLATVMLGSGGFGSCPTISSPGVPEEQLKPVRAAFAKALNSPDLVAEAKKKGLEAELISGEELEGLAREVTTQSPEVIGLIRKLVGE
ncbi:MAG TPA: tripartite tricarboxylate transporter substrate-binding protein [Candidatus Binatia bacterium]|jgi:tripartite-type tricarboxylate transporter receptor subunit TctC|nr:tripartite tricarboxylate transporter substrate-binding protein [Candidatus Binatia bacterium]